MVFYESQIHLLRITANFVLQVRPVKVMSIYQSQGHFSDESPWVQRLIEGSKELTSQPRPFPRLQAFFSPFLRNSRNLGSKLRVGEVGRCKSAASKLFSAVSISAEPSKAEDQSPATGIRPLTIFDLARRRYFKCILYGNIYVN